MPAAVPSRRFQTVLLWLGFLALVWALPAGLKAAWLGRVQRGLLATGLWQPATSSLPAGGPLPDLALRTLDGRAAHLRDFRGKVVFLNLWASWCPPCRAELPDIQRLYAQADSAKVAFVLLSLDKNPEAARRVVEQEHYTVPVYLPAADLPAPFDVSAIPATFIIDPTGRLASRTDGMAAYDTPHFRRFLQRLSRAGR